MDLVGWDPAPDDIPLVRANPDNPRRRVALRSMNAKAEHVEQSSDGRACAVVSVHRQPVGGNDVNLAVGVWIGPRIGRSDGSRFYG